MQKSYATYFHLSHDPFGETPNPRFFFESATHCAAIEGLLRSVRSGQGFSLLTGEVGTGKTLVTRILLQALSDTTDSALILYPRCSEAELLNSICEELEIPGDASLSDAPASPKQALDRINKFLLENARAGRRTLLVIDEAQNLSVATLETVRLLSNLETNERKLLHILLVAQPEFRDQLALPELRQLRQRLGTDISLSPLNLEETSAYVSYRLGRAGGANFVRFDEAARRLLHRFTGGVPREINRHGHELLSFAAENEIRLLTARVLRTWAAGRRPRSWKFWQRRENLSP